MSADAEPRPAPDVSRDALHLLTPYLDVHMVFPLLAFAESLGAYDAGDLKRARLSLLEKTHMVDYAISQLSPGETPPPEMLAHRQAVVDTLASLRESAGPMLEVVGADGSGEGEGLDAIRSAEDPIEALEARGVTGAVIDAFFSYAKFQYECGKYGDAARLLSVYREFAPEGDRAFDALMGKLAAQILTLEWDSPAVAVCMQDMEIIIKMLNDMEGT